MTRLFVVLVSSLNLGMVFSVASPASFTFESTDEGSGDGVELSPCPGGTDFCEDPPDFPNVTNIFGNFNNQNFYNEKIDLRIGSSIVGRDKDSQLHRACDVKKSTIRPRKARDLSGKFRFILNSKQYEQAVDIEQCIGGDKPCTVDSDAPSGGSTVCRQQYANYRLLSLDEQGKDIINFFNLPSACICHHQNNPFFGARVNIPEQKSVKSEIALKDQLPLCEKKSLEDFPAIGPRSGIIKNNDRIVFLDDQSDGPKFPRFSQNLRARGCSRRGKTFCEKSSSSRYPADLVRSLIERQSSDPKIYFELEKLQQECGDPEPSIATRTAGFTPNEQQLCKASKRIIVPQQALNIKNEWRYIVNLENYTQSVNIEECRSSRRSRVNSAGQKEFGSCLYSGVPGNNPHFTVCKQLHREHKLLAITEEGQLEIDKFRLPSACACHKSASFNEIEFRFGSSSANNQNSAGKPEVIGSPSTNNPERMGFAFPGTKN